MQKQTSPSREADNDVRDALESIVLQIEGPEEPRDTKVVSDAHGMVHLSEQVKDTMPPLFSSTMLVPTVGDALELTRGDVYTIGKSNEIVFFGASASSFFSASALKLFSQTHTQHSSSNITISFILLVRPDLVTTREISAVDLQGSSATGRYTIPFFKKRYRVAIAFL